MAERSSGSGRWSGGAVAAALFWIRDWLARGVVVVAELFAAEAGAGAAASVGEDVAALVLLGRFGGVLHGASPRGTFLCKLFGGQGIGLDLAVRFSLSSG
jgi:hypothetical protein